MDRPVDRGYRTRRWIRRGLGIAATAATVTLALVVLVGWIRPTIERTRIRTAVVERGVMEATLTAAGRVVPEYEHVITSPIDSRVRRILHTPGASVAEGEPIVTLEVGETSAELAEIEDRIALARSARDRAVLDGERERGALTTRREIERLELESREFEAERARKHFGDGIFSRDEVRRAENAASRARIELREIDESLANLEDTLRTRLDGLDLEIAILERNRVEVDHRLERATATSDRVGVLTWVVPREGAAVRRGEELARIADLSAFRVEATVSDVHADRIAAGQEVFVRSGDHRIEGSVTRVRPTVENGSVTLEVALDESSHPALRHNLRVEVFLVTDRESDALRVRRGTYLMRDGTHAAFVIRGETAVRTPVRFGITNIDYYQVLDGLDEGDEVIVSDMSDRMHLKEVRLR
jgi:HlyD family secretion protein